MDDKTRVIFRLHERNENGELEDLRNEFDLGDFGGTIPVVGDSILDPGVITGSPRFKHDNRTIYEVKERYFLPGKGSSLNIVWIALVVEERCGLREETTLFD